VLFRSLRYLYEDNPRVIICPGQGPYLGDEHEQHHKNVAAKNGWKYYSIATTNVNLAIYQEYFYKSVGHLFEYRYSKFQLPKRKLVNNEFIEKVKPKEPYALCYAWDKIRNGLIINFQADKISPNLKRLDFVPGYTKNLFDWLPIIYDAEEIHCSPGGPFHLIDSVLPNCKAKRFVYHDARAQTCFNPNNKFNNKCWEQIGYPIKHAQ